MYSKISENKTQKTNFTQVPNEILNSQDLSWKAKGLWAYMAGKPEGWQFTLKGMASQCKDSYTATNGALKELLQFRLIERKVVMTKDGKKCFYSIYEKPNMEKPNMEKPNMEKPNMESQSLESQAWKTDVYSNTNISNKEKVILKESNTDKLDKKKKVNKKEQLQKNYEIVCEEFEDEELRQSWRDFLEMRLEQHNKTYTEKGIRLKIKEFKNSINGDIELGKAALDQAVAENWMGWHINESTKLLKNDYRPSVENKAMVYQPKDGEDITYKEMFDFWKNYVRVSVPQTEEQVKACKELLEDIGVDGLQRLIVALAMRSKHSFLPAELTKIKDFVGLRNNAVVVQNFYDQHWQYWQQLQKAAQEGKEVWEV